MDNIISLCTKIVENISGVVDDTDNNSEGDVNSFDDFSIDEDHRRNQWVSFFKFPGRTFKDVEKDLIHLFGKPHEVHTFKDTDKYVNNWTVNDVLIVQGENTCYLIEDYEIVPKKKSKKSK